jgi:hypothetical protein
VRHRLTPARRRHAHAAPAVPRLRVHRCRARRRAYHEPEQLTALRPDRYRRAVPVWVNNREMSISVEGFRDTVVLTQRGFVHRRCEQILTAQLSNVGY